MVLLHPYAVTKDRTAREGAGWIDGNYSYSAAFAPQLLNQC